jgi:hypothetical protein
MPSAARLVSMSTSPKNVWPGAWSGTDDKALVNFASASAKGGIDHEGERALCHVCARRSDKCVDIVGIGQHELGSPRRLRKRSRSAPLLSLLCQLEQLGEKCVRDVTLFRGGAPLKVFATALTGPLAGADWKGNAVVSIVLFWSVGFAALGWLVFKIAELM